VSSHNCISISTVRQFIDAVENHYLSWDTLVFPWFRGEPLDPDVKPLLPKLYRNKHDENALLQFFRMRVPALGLPLLPGQRQTDQWRFWLSTLGCLLAF